jgi:hypothetical protein
MTGTPALEQVRLSLKAWTARLMDAYPWFDDQDLAAHIEGKTGLALGPADVAVVRTLYLRAKLRAWRPRALGLGTCRS